MPHCRRFFADNATIDLKPFASNAQKKIAAAIAIFQKNEDGLRWRRKSPACVSPTSPSISNPLR